MLLFAAAVTCKPATKLAEEILDSSPYQLPPLLAGPTGLGFGQIEAGALYCGRIISDRPFPGGPGDNTLIGFSYLRHLIEEAGCPWPSGMLEVEIAKATKALEAGRIDEHWFADSVCGAVAEEVWRLGGQQWRR